MEKEIEEQTVGIVHGHNFVFGDTENDCLPLDCGKKLKHVMIHYEVYGTLSQNADNAILVEHALTGNAHLAGKHSREDVKPGWWDAMTGPGKPFDTSRYFIVCSNVLGGCSGSTGPSSIDPDTDEKYNQNFPVITIADMVRAQKRLMDHLKIKKWLAVAGGSMGGMLALQWATAYPDHVNATIAIATTGKVSPQSIAFDWVGRQAIMSDSTFKNGEYETQPKNGLAIARMLAHITYLSEEGMRTKFGRHLKNMDYSFHLVPDFQVETYLEHQGIKFVERFDANSYIFITRAMDYFEIPEDKFSNVKSPFLVVSFSSDWLFPPNQSKEIVKSLLANKVDVSYCNIESSYGHDAFLLETERLGKLITAFLKKRYDEVKK